MSTYGEALRCGPYAGSFLIEDGGFVEIPGSHQTGSWSVAKDMNKVSICKLPGIDVCYFVRSI